MKSENTLRLLFLIHNYVLGPSFQRNKRRIGVDLFKNLNMTYFIIIKLLFSDLFTLTAYKDLKTIGVLFSFFSHSHNVFGGIVSIFPYFPLKTVEQFV